MKSITKRISVIFVVAVYALTMLAGIRFFDWSAKIAFAAEAEGNVGRTYYYEELNELSKKFYNAIDDMAKSGDLKKGDATYDLVGKGVITEEDVQNYVSRGFSKIPVSFGCARDAYYMDHPELFYIDIYKLSLSAGTMDGGKYVCYIDAGRADDYYISNDFNSVEDVDKAITAFNKKVDEIVGVVSGMVDDAGKISYVNKAICETVTYDFCANDSVKAAHTQTAYGALVNGRAVCGGYGMAFKAVMDKLEIPCVCIQGSALPAGGSGYAAHMWNAVKLDGMWYGVDTTWNDTDKTGENDVAFTKNYLLVGSGKLNKTHESDGVISTSGFCLKYPALKPYDYGVDVDPNGMKITGKYEHFENSEGCFVTVSYEGKGARALAKEGKYLAYRYFSRDDKTGKITPTGWIGAAALIDWDGSQATDINLDTPTEHTVYLNNYCFSIQFVIASVKPYGFYDETFNTTFDYAYGWEIKPEHLLTEASIPYENEEFENYKPAPLPVKITPDAIIELDKQTYQDVTIKYSDTLEYLEGETAPKISVLTTYGDMVAQDFVRVESVEYNAETSELSFRFYPSTQYSHDCLVYRIAPTNLVGSYSKKAPDPVSIVAKRQFYICNKMLPGGRLYVKAYGEPVMVANEDMSMSGFKDKNGNILSQNQRSQLMLVVNKTSDAKSAEMKDKIKNEAGVDLTKSATYEIDLHVCGVLQKVPEGSFMQVGFGFPEGYGPEDEGMTFKVYHYKTVNGELVPEEVPCVVTKDGIVATVNSFSPFAVVAVDKSAVTTKNIYAQAVTDGGKVTCTDGNGVKTLNGGKSATYDITPEAGYKIESVLLNGEPVDISGKENGGAFSFNADDLDASNKVEVSFVSEKAAERHEGVTIVRPVITVTADDIPEAIAHAADANPAGGIWAMVLIVLAVVIVVAGVSAGALLFVRKKNPGRRK